MGNEKMWQRAVDTARLVIVISGIVLFIQVNGIRHGYLDAGFLGGFAAMLLWLRFARPRLGLQTVIVCLMLCYALLAPIVAGGHAGGLIFVAGLLLPLTLVGAWIYFEARGKPRRDEA